MAQQLYSSDNQSLNRQYLNTALDMCIPAQIRLYPVKRAYTDDLCLLLVGL